MMKNLSEIHEKEKAMIEKELNTLIEKTFELEYELQKVQEKGLSE